jgi:hypothetical protein
MLRGSYPTMVKTFYHYIFIFLLDFSSFICTNVNFSFLNLYLFNLYLIYFPCYVVGLDSNYVTNWFQTMVQEKKAILIEVHIS